MFLSGTLLNAVAVLVGGLIGTIVVILAYQGGVAAGATLLQGALSDRQLQEMSATGGLLVIGVGLKLLRIRDVGVADFLPAIVIAPLLVALTDALGGLLVRN